MTRFDKTIPRWCAVATPIRFRELMPQWRIVARATFELVPAYSERIFVTGDNVLLAACSLSGWGYVHFERPLTSPMLRAYSKDGLEPAQLIEVSEYIAKFKTFEWSLDSNRIEEFIFEGQFTA
jgi:hypothetical protein